MARQLGLESLCAESKILEAQTAAFRTLSFSRRPHPHPHILAAAFAPDTAERLWGKPKMMGIPREHILMCS